MKRLNETHCITLSQRISIRLFSHTRYLLEEKTTLCPSHLIALYEDSISDGKPSWRINIAIRNGATESQSQQGNERSGWEISEILSQLSRNSGEEEERSLFIGVHGTWPIP